MEKKDKIELEEEKKRMGNEIFTLFLMMVPSLLIAMTAAITSTLIRVMFQVMLIFIQTIVIKNFLDRYYNFD